MRVEGSLVNPLPSLFECIPKEGIILNKSTLTNIGNMFKVGGITTESYQEVLALLHYLKEWYSIVEVKQIDTNYYLFKKEQNGEIAQ